MDHFAVFRLPPRPWIDVDALKSDYLRRSTDLHPDKAPPGGKLEAGACFGSLTESFNVLRNTRQRLLHLLDLSGFQISAHVQRVPPAALEFFTPIANITKAAEELLKEKGRAHSPMLQVGCFERALELTDVLQRLQEQLTQTIRTLEIEVQSLDQQWLQGHSNELILQVHDAATALAFLERWAVQIQRLLAALAF
jgi:hypothetical protein